MIERSLALRVIVLMTVMSLMLVIGACHRDSETTQAVEVQKLLETDRAFAAASLESGTPDAFYNNLTDDALALIADGVAITGRAGIREHLRPLGLHVLSWTPQKAEVSASRDLGWTWGEWKLLASARSGEELARGKYLNVWKRDAKGMWKVAVDMGNSAPPKDNAAEGAPSAD